MPADADLLCEYYISSALKTKSLNNINSSSSSTTTQVENDSKLLLLQATAATTSSIDFVKYDKNPMDLLKSKYHLLNNNNNNNNSTVSSLPPPNALTLSAAAAAASNSSNELNLLFKNAAWLDLNWSKIRKIGIGLLNLGNNCYLNATLQCLAYTPPLSQWLVAKPHSPSCKFKTAKGFCSLCEVERIIYDIFNSSGNGGCAKPNTLCFNIKKISNVFGVGTQEDASEFFTTLLESMAKSIKFAINPAMANLNAHNNNNNTPSPSGTNNKRTTTILDDIFSFQFRSRITCSNCNRVSDTIENTNTWPVDVKYVQDVRKGMLHFLREEVLDGENAYKCDKCKKKTRATKKYSIRTAPNILVVHLKRFDFSYGGKLSHYVAYPEMLSLKSFIPEPAAAQQSLSSTENGSPQSQANLNNNANSVEKALRNVSYKLYGVLVHLGNTSHSGHYYSYVRGPNDVWYKADDQRINTVQLRDALAQNAYILFYNRTLTPTAVATTPHLNNGASLVTEKMNSCSSSTIIPRQITINGNTTTMPSTKNIPTLIKTDSMPSNKPVISATNYLNSLNSSSQSSTVTSTSTVPKIVIKFKKPTSFSSSSSDSQNIDSANTSVSLPPLPIYGPQLPPNLLLLPPLSNHNKSADDQSQESPKKVNLLTQLLNMVDMKKLKKKVKKFSLKKLKRLKKSLSISDVDERKQKLRKILLKEKKKKLNKLPSANVSTATTTTNKAKLDSTTPIDEPKSTSLKRKRSSVAAGDSEDNNDNSSLCSLSSLSSSFSSTISASGSSSFSSSSSSSSSGSASSASLDVDTDNNNNKKKKKKKKKNKTTKKLKTLDDGKVNSLALLRQYHSYSSPSPSPTPPSTTTTTTTAAAAASSPAQSTTSSLSSMSSFNTSKEEEEETTTMTPTKKEQLSLNAIPDTATTTTATLYSYNSSNKLPILVSNNSNTTTNAHFNIANVFDEIRNTSTILSLKKWNEEKSELSKSNSKFDNGFSSNKRNADDEKDIDEYNEEFDMPFERQPKQKFNSFNKFNNNANNSFHNFTHRLNSSNNNSSWNNSNWNKGHNNSNYGNKSWNKNSNGNNNNSNYNNNRNTWSNSNNNNYRNNNGNNRFNKHYNKH